MARIDKLGYSDKALKALMAGQYDQLTGRDPGLRSSKDQLSLVPALLGMKTGHIKVSTSMPKTTQKRSKSPSERGQGTLYDFASGMSRNGYMKSAEKNMKTAEDLNKLTEQINLVNAMQNDPRYTNPFEQFAADVPKQTSENPFERFAQDVPKKESKSIVDQPVMMPKDNSKATKAKEENDARQRAIQYQQNIDADQKKYQYDETARQNNTLDKKDQAYLQRIFDRYGDGEITRRSLQESKQTQGWEQKYGKSLDQIYADFLADQGNVRMDLAERHPFLAEAGTLVANIPTSVATLPSLVGNIVAPESEFAQRAEEARRQNEENRKFYRAGVKEHTGDTGDKVIDTLNAVADRMAATAAGKALGGQAVGGVMAGLSDANQQMENLNLRPDMDARKKALSAAEHGAIEGLGTAITTGILDKLPAVEGLGGSLLNIGKGAGNAAFENFVSELIEMGADTGINKENSQKELNKQVYMLQGMSEEEAERAARMDQVRQAAMALGTGALFGGGMTGISQLGRAISGKVLPSLFAKKPSPQDADVIDNARVQAEEPKAEVETLKDQTPAVEEAPREVVPQETPKNVQEAPNRMPTKEEQELYQQELMEDLGWDDAAGESAPKSYIENLRDTLENAEPIDKAEALVNGGYYADSQEAGEAYRNGTLDADVEKYLSLMEKNGDPTPTKAQIETNDYDAAKLKDVYNGDWDAMRKGTIKEYTGADDEKVDQYYKELSQFFTGSGNQANAEVLDDYVEHAPTYKGEIRRGMHFGMGDGEYDKFMEKVHGSGLVTLDKPSSWASDWQVARRFSHLRDPECDSVEIVCTQNRTSTPVSFANMHGEDEVLSSSKAAWTVLKEDSAVLDSGAKKTILYVAETGEDAPKNNAVVMPDGNDPNAPEYVAPDVDTQKVAETTQSATPGTYDIDSTIGNDGKERFFVVETRPDGTEDFAEQGKFYDTEEEAQAAIDNITRANSTGIEKNPTITETVEPEVKPAEPEPQKMAEPEEPVAEDAGATPPPDETPVEPEEKVRSFSRRGSEDESLPDEIRESLSEDYYKVVKNADTEARAEGLFDGENLAQTRSNLTQAVKDHDPAAASLGYKLAKAYVDEGNYDAATDVIEEVSAELTRMGQFTQAAKLAMMQNDPMAALRSYERELRNLNQWGREKYGKKWNKIELSDEDVKEFGNIRKGDKDALNNLVSKLNAKFGKQIPANWWDKVVSASKTAMLLNPRTQLKNALANVASLPLRSMSDRVSALGQGATYLIKKIKNPDTDFKRTQSIFGGTRKQKQIATEIWDQRKVDITGDNKMKDSAKSDIISHRQIFNDDFFAKWIDKMTDGGIQKLNEKLGSDANKSTMETLQNLTYWLMGDLGDTPFVKKNFVNRLASYMKAQGIENVEDVPDDAIAIATQEALKATFKDDNAFTKALQGVKQKTGKFGEVALPFVKTPANLTMRAIDYSPAGIVNALRKAKNGAEATAVIDELAKNLTGTALIYAGYKLAEKGLISGTYSKNKSEAAFQKQQGMLEYALHIGDNYYTYDWLEPAATPLVIGTTIYEAIKNSDEENATASDVINGLYKGGLNVANTIINSSPLQSLSDLLGSDSNDENGIMGNFANEVMEFPQRLIPSMLGATARTIDPVLRDTYVAEDTLTGAIGNQIRQAEAKIPFLSKTLPASYDTWGNERTRSDTKGEAFVAQMVNPGQLGNKNETPLDAEIQRLFDATGNQNVYPLFAARSLDLGSDGYKTLTNKEHSEYQRVMGQRSYQMAETLMNSKEYESLNDDEKASALKTVYDLSNAITKEELFDHTTDSDKRLKEIYRTKGVKAAVDYIVDRKKADRLGVNIDTYYKKQSEYEGGVDQYVADKAEADKLGLSVDTYNKKNAEYEGGATQYAEDKKTAESFGITADKFEKMKSKAGSYSDKAVDALPVLQGMGFSNPYVAADYANASAKVPGLDINTFATNFRRMDGNSDDTLTQKEVTDYLNNNNIDDSTAQTLWLYGNFHKSGDPNKETKLKRNKKNKWVSYYD